MTPITALWLPILLSAVAVFIASNILWMMVPFWHRTDYSKLENEKALLDAVSSAKSGQYLAPHVNWSKLPAEEREAMMQRPMAFTLVRNPARFSFPTALGSYFLYLLVISTLIAYVADLALRPAAAHRDVFHFVAIIGLLAYAFGSVGDSIWYGKPWSVTAKVIVDGIIYGVLTAVVFAWLWPHP